MHKSAGGNFFIANLYANPLSCQFPFGAHELLT